MAEALRQIYEELKDVPKEDLKKEVQALLKKLIQNHKRILFNGNGYTQEWVDEAEKRGLYNLVSLPDAMPHFIDGKNIDLYTRHHIFSKEEIYSRYEILLENYVKTIHIESLALQDMVKKDFTPALISYVSDISQEVLRKKELLPSLPSTYEETLITTLTHASEEILTALKRLEKSTDKAEGTEDALTTGQVLSR